MSFKMEKTLSKIQIIIHSWGIDPRNFQPSQELLNRLGDDGKPMTLHSFGKIIRGSKQASLHEAKRLAEWLEVTIDEL